jgi:ribosomal protein L29
MAKVKMKDLKNMSKEDRKKKISELKLELIKSKVSTTKTGSAKPKEIRRTIARLLTIKEK